MWRRRRPTILTTSQLLTTGVDAPTCKNIVLARVVGSMTEFKQIIGRGTRVRDDYGKLWFNILDYTGSATRMFADPAFDGDPAHADRGGADGGGETKVITETEPQKTLDERRAQRSSSRRARSAGSSTSTAARSRSPPIWSTSSTPNGKQLRVVRYTDYAAETASARSARPPRSCARSGPTRPSGPRSSSDWPSGASASTSWPKPPSSPRPTRSTCSATSPSTPRCAPAASGPSGFASRAQGLLRPVRPRGARRFWRSCWRNMPSTATPSSSCPTSCRCRRSPITGSVGEIIALFGGADQLRHAVTELQNLLYAA